MCDEIVCRGHLLAFVDDRRRLVEPLLLDESQCEIRALRRAEAARRPRRANPTLLGRCAPRRPTRAREAPPRRSPRRLLWRSAPCRARGLPGGGRQELTRGVEVAARGERHASPVEQPRAVAATEVKISHARESLIDEALELDQGVRPKRIAVTISATASASSDGVDAPRACSIARRASSVASSAWPIQKQSQPRVVCGLGEILVVARVAKLGDDAVELSSERRYLASGMATPRALRESGRERPPGLPGRSVAPRSTASAMSASQRARSPRPYCASAAGQHGDGVQGRRVRGARLRA